jgi:Sugar kinases, ribokinase family
MAGKQPFIVAFNDNVVDCYRDQHVMYPGGNCVNHAVYARRAGARTAYAGAVSDDAAGRAIRDALVREGVDVSRLRIVPGDTAYCVIDLKDGERVFVGANLGVSIVAPESADLALFRSADALHTGRSSHIDAWLPALSGITRISYDFATVRDAAKIGALASHCFLASFSGGGLTRDEAAHLAKTAREVGATWVLVTRGDEGALLAGPDGMMETSVAPVTPVDTLGAGDTFIARTLVGLLRAENPGEILPAAARAAADTCLERGAFGYGSPMDVKLFTAMSIEDIYRTTRPVSGPVEA